jgi:hypothetical protein
MNRIVLLAAAAMVAAIAPSDAKVLKLATSTGSTTIGGPFDVIIDDTTGKEVNFSLGSARRVAITYAANCALLSSGSTLTLEIRVDDIAVLPTDLASYAFCSSTTPISTSMTVVANLEAGAHVVKVYASTFGGGGGSSGVLDKSTLLIFD